jgi:hypothetical protein
MSRSFTAMFVAIACDVLRANGAVGQVVPAGSGAVTSLLIWVHDTAGHPMAKAQIGILNVDDDRTLAPVVTDSLGQLICSTEPGRYRFSVRVPGYRVAVTNNVMLAGPADTLRFVLRVQTQPQEPGVPHASNPPDPNAPPPGQCAKGTKKP